MQYRVKRGSRGNSLFTHSLFSDSPVLLCVYLFFLS